MQKVCLLSCLQQFISGIANMSVRVSFFEEVTYIFDHAAGKWAGNLKIPPARTIHPWIIARMQKVVCDERQAKILLSTKMRLRDDPDFYLQSHKTHIRHVKPFIELVHHYVSRSVQDLVNEMKAFNRPMAYNWPEEIVSVFSVVLSGDVQVLKFRPSSNKVSSRSQFATLC